MRKLIAAMNMTLDGVCDHTVGIADDEIHQHYTELLRGAGLLIYGRKTFELMEYWRGVAANPTGNEADDDFAATIDGIPKIVYSRTMESVDWNGTELKREIDKDELLNLKQQSSKSILVGSPSLIICLGDLGLIDEYQLAIHPIIAGRGMRLFTDDAARTNLKLIKTKPLKCGVVVLYYETT